MRPSELRKVIRRAHAQTLAHEDKLADDLTAVFDQAGKIAAKNFKDKAVSITAAAWSAPLPDELVDIDALVAKLRSKSDPIRRSAIQEYGAELEAAARDAGIRVNWDLTNPFVGNALAGAGQHVTYIANTTRLNVMRSIEAAYDQGLTIPDTAKLIQEGMNAASPARGRLIARTELAAVANGGSLAAVQIVADETGDTYYKQWLTAPGARYPRHEDYDGLDGQTVALDETFTVGDAQLHFPGDPDGPPEEICNCRCALVYVTEPAEVVPADEQPDVGQAAGAVVSETLEGAVTYTARKLSAAATSGSEWRALADYSEQPYISGALRAGNVLPEVKLIDAVMERTTIPTGITYRGIRDPDAIREALGMDAVRGDIENAPYGFKFEDAVGKTFTDPGFMSTTLNRKLAAEQFGPVLLELRLPDGTHGVYLPKIGINAAEKELLLDRDLSFTITSARQETINGNKTIVLTADAKLPKVAPVRVDPSASIPGSLDLRSTPSSELGGSLNEVYKIEVVQPSTATTFPAVLATEQFDSAARADKLRVIFRGVRGANATAAADASRAGEIGSGDFGKGIYLTQSPASAVGYAQAYGGDRRGFVLRAIVSPKARIATERDLPSGFDGKPADWAAANGYDGYETGVNYVIVTNPKVLAWDDANYSISTASEHLWGQPPPAATKEYIVKPDPNEPRLRARLIAEMTGEEISPGEAANWGNSMLGVRESIPFGKDLERERAAYAFSRSFNEVGGDDFHVEVPPFRIGEITHGTGTIEGTVERAGISSYVPDSTAAVDWGRGWKEELKYGDAQELRSAGLFDAIIGNTDRHPGNWLYDENGKMVLIDHGLAFPVDNEPGEYGNRMIVRHAVERFGRELDGDELAFLERLRDRWPEIDKELTPLLPAAERTAMRQRISYLIDAAERVTLADDASSSFGPSPAPWMP